MTVKEYIEARPETVYGKKIRILNSINHKYLGEWTDWQSAYVLSAKITSKFIFIFI